MMTCDEGQGLVFSSLLSKELKIRAHTNIFVWKRVTVQVMGRHTIKTDTVHMNKGDQGYHDRDSFRGSREEARW